MKKVLKKCYEIGTTLLVCIIGILAVLLVGVRLVGLTPYSVLSGSMEPAYPVGSLIYVQKVVPEAVQVGDPITFVLNEDLTVATHRVVEIDSEKSYFYTKGDANEVIDASPVHYNNLIGKPIFMIPKLGYLASFLSTQRGMIVGGCAFAFVMLLLFAPDILRWAQDKDASDTTISSE